MRGNQRNLLRSAVVCCSRKAEEVRERDDIRVPLVGDRERWHRHEVAGVVWA
jgi:hypothetical protein